MVWLGFVPGAAGWQARAMSAASLVTVNSVNGVDGYASNIKWVDVFVVGYAIANAIFYSSSHG